jgi:hypothetical protein
MARFATKIVTLFEPGSDPKDEADKLDAQAHVIAQTEGTHSVAWAIDPTTWQGVLFRLSYSPPEAAVNATTYQVLHLSAPEIELLH